MQFHVASEYERASIWKRIFPLIRQSLYQGDKVLFHCIAGRHRAAGAGTVTTAIMGAEEAIPRRRPIQLQSAFEDWKLSDWAHKIVRSATLAAPLPKAVARAASEKSHVHILSEDEGKHDDLVCPQARPGTTTGAEGPQYHVRQARSHCMVFYLFVSGCRERAPASFFAAVI